MKKEFYQTESVDSRITAIRSACGEIMYLIVGSEKALLMDTNLGVGNLRGLVETLTDKPYEVVLTHGHVDHSLGAPAFDRVYMNRQDIPIYQKMSPLEERIGYLHGNLGPGYDEFEFEPEDFVAPDPNYPFLDLEEGHTFELGGVHVDVYSLAGHTPGSMVLLVRESRTLITGDACNNVTFMFDGYSTVSEYRNRVIQLKEKLSGKFDKVLMCHHVMEAGKDLLDNMVEVCDIVIAGKAADKPLDFMGKQVLVAMECNQFFERLDHKCGNLVYSKDFI